MIIVSSPISTRAGVAAAQVELSVSGFGTLTYGTDSTNTDRIEAQAMSLRYTKSSSLHDEVLHGEEAAKWAEVGRQALAKRMAENSE